ncbi:MAG: hypothetical protein Q8M11_14660 [Sulfuritalea sp.]|nr:hypothetical protein [Sulfuritalea sp.]MDP1983069.1 hypothetical protein [Sulfuritalea sp.]
MPFVISADAEPNSYVHRWVSLIYGEAFRRLGIPVQISSFPQARGTALANQGSVDGQAGRIRAYGDTHPDMVRVEEPVMDFTGLRKLFDLASVQTYPYVNRKHAALAPKLADVLKQMRAEGLLKAYPQQAEREMGWTR